MRQPISVSIIGTRHGIGIPRGLRHCACAGTWGPHGAAECPFNYNTRYGEWPPGFAQGGSFYVGDWQGPPSPTHPHGSDLTDAAAARWVAYITRHHIPRAAGKPIARLNAPDIPDPSPPRPLVAGQRRP